jgi:hypothetical protein
VAGVVVVVVVVVGAAIFVVSFFVESIFVESIIAAGVVVVVVVVVAAGAASSFFSPAHADTASTAATRAKRFMWGISKWVQDTVETASCTQSSDSFLIYHF